MLKKILIVCFNSLKNINIHDASIKIFNSIEIIIFLLGIRICEKYKINRNIIFIILMLFLFISGIFFLVWPLILIATIRLMKLIKLTIEFSPIKIDVILNPIINPLYSDNLSLYAIVKIRMEKIMQSMLGIK